MGTNTREYVGQLQIHIHSELIKNSEPPAWTWSRWEVGKYNFFRFVVIDFSDKSV